MPRSEPVVASVMVRAAPEKVFRFFTEPEALVQWMGERADVEARPGGRFVVEIRGETIRGEYVDVEPPRRLRITWGRDGSTVLPPSSSELHIRLEPVADGTLVTVAHHGLPAGEQARHGDGWRHFLAVLAEQGAAVGGS